MTATEYLRRLAELIGGARLAIVVLGASVIILIALDRGHYDTALLALGCAVFHLSSLYWREVADIFHDELVEVGACKDCREGEH